jgi:NADPH:quinone reductase-like Zn-dependent oxidoreductase
MRAVLQERYGPPEEALRVVEVAEPVPEDDEVLVRVHASTVTRGQATAVRFKDFRLLRVVTGLRRPRDPRCGSEFAGTIEKVGGAVTEFHAGDEVFGMQAGANAEYVTVRPSGAGRALSPTGIVLPRPVGVTLEEAAAIPDGALLALSMLRPVSPLEGKSVLVYGAAGSIGSAAVQLLVQHFGAEVTAVCDTRDVECVQSLGAREVLDRFQQDFTRNGQKYDLIFDAVGKHSFRRCRRSLTPRGRYISTDLGYMYHLPLLSLLTRIFGKRRAMVGIGRYNKEDLLLIKGLVEAGKYRPVIGRTYALDEIVEATRYVESGQKTGSVVVHV